jgi:hypothetical protein
MTCEAVQNRLPARALQIDGMGVLSIEGHPHADAIAPRDELDLGRAVAEGVLDARERRDPGVRAGEVEAEAAVFRALSDLAESGWIPESGEQWFKLGAGEGGQLSWLSLFRKTCASESSLQLSRAAPDEPLPSGLGWWPPPSPS